MKRTVLLIINLLILTTVAFAQSKALVVKSNIKFQIKNLGINTGGTIGGLQTDVHFNPADLTSSTLAASVDVNTLSTDNSSRDAHLRSEDFFDLAHYPKISLKSVSFKHKSGNNYTGQFNLTIKDKTRLMEILFTYIDKGNTVAFNSSFKLNRLDFGLGGSSMIMANEVIVTIDAEAGK
jgi:polyisoprenoid-binding protein YceI